MTTRTQGKLLKVVRAVIPHPFECDDAHAEGVRVRTPFLLPDRDMVDIFVLEREDGLAVTDLGDAIGWLYYVDGVVEPTPLRQRMVVSVCRDLGVAYHQGQLVVRGVKRDDLLEAILLVSQAVLRVADITFTVRQRFAPSRADKVSSWLDGWEVPYARFVRKRGASGRYWNVDFETYAEGLTADVFLLSGSSVQHAQNMVNWVGEGMRDIWNACQDRRPPQFVALRYGPSRVWREVDAGPVACRATIVDWSRREDLRLALTAVHSR